MDSGNSGSLQSSSGGDDEFDSRCGGGVDSSPLSALLRQSASPSMAAGLGGSFYGLQELASMSPPPLQLPHISQAAHQWSAALPAGGGAGAGAVASPSTSSPHGIQEQAAPGQQAVGPAPRGSRKRTRASRRAPTTVLTTDTCNFRAMVQEFTGIPSPPFAGPPARSRFDHLFPAPSSLRSAAASLSPYLLRPFAQKLHTSPFASFPSSSTSSPSPSNVAIATSIAASATASTAAAAPSDGYQLASAPSSSLLGMQDHMSGSYLSFQSHLGAQLSGDGKYTAHPMFDASGRDLAPPPPQILQDPADFPGLTHGIMSADASGTHMRNPRSRDHGHGACDELSGVVGGASMTGSDRGCKKTTAYSSGAGAVHERNAESTSTGAATTTPSSAAAATTAMRTQGVDSRICTSEVNLLSSFHVHDES
ncbi:hypothetical protein GUJ93_ZPchr0008g11388 [Zizania palustris]|uniref:VQ domain-containing protein n=1 Tax=Zizania palustris TaxID=103762 RepID=A0A8J5RD26_ZIZPA|nr:hypothetical protein GUJ93_ZPchr0008g11388 [Zizania palustris]